MNCARGYQLCDRWRSSEVGAVIQREAGATKTEDLPALAYEHCHCPISDEGLPAEAVSVALVVVTGR